MKTCLRCREQKPFEEFHRSRRDGYQAWCKACRKVYDASYHQTTRELRIRQKRTWKRVRARWLQELKRRPCADCGGKFEPVAMQFDHRPGTVKAFDLSSGIGRYSHERILAEIAKCDIVCANCHAVRTHKRRGVAQPG